MGLVVTEGNGTGRALAGLAMVALLSVGATACGSSGHSASVTTGSSSVGNQTQSTLGATTTTGNGSSAGKSVDVTNPSGYVFSVRLAAAGVTSMTSFTTDDGSGTGGTTENTPPGSKLLVAQFVFTNDSGRAEPLFDAPVGPMPADASNSQLALAVPQADYAAFGIDTSSASQICNTSSGTDSSYQTQIGYPSLAPPSGYCYLLAQVAAFSPVQADITQPPQVQAGADGTVTLIVSYAVNGLRVPQGAPVSAVRAFAEKNSTCNCWSPLG